MVVFTCAHCGDSIQKPKVEKHYDTKCRNNFPDLCCVDCLKDFRGDEFKAHTKCISEAERYGGKGFVAKANKGEKKQNEWIEIVQSVLDENLKMSGSLKSLLERVAQQPNTPRKRAKFINFVTSMDRRTNPKDIEGAWDLLSAKLELLKKNNESQRKENGKSEDSTVSSSTTNDEIKMETENGLDNKNTEKENKKKSKKHNDDTSVENNENSQLDITTDSVNEKKTKKNKKQKTIDNETSQINGENDVTIDEEVSPLSENGVKKSKKNKIEKMETNDEIVQEATTTAPEEKTLTKKEKKEKKKRERYEAQLKEIEAAKPELNESIVEDVVEEKKKSKKRKLEQNSHPVENGTVLKEKSLPQENGVNEEPAEKKLKNDGPTEFHWTEAILSVIGNKGKDISLKKLQKRVLTEYCVTHNITDLNDRINKKFTKTLNRIANVRIENDKVRIVDDE